MKLVTYEPAAGCDRLGALVASKVVDVALARDAYQAATHENISVLPSNMMTFLSQGDSAMRDASTIVD